MTTVVNRGLSKELRSIYILIRYLDSSRKIIIRLEVIKLQFWQNSSRSNGYKEGEGKGGGMAQSKCGSIFILGDIKAGKGV